MKKCQTEYYKQLDDYTTLTIKVNEEVKDHMLVKFYDDRNRSKSAHIKLLESIIKELKSFNP